ncbi:hypothetical protein [Enterococcus rotai]|uniref:hypothetical protein n=1 Tax=Enterococcus rotai TaxID=118060 RepID=UPI0035C70EE6
MFKEKQFVTAIGIFVVKAINDEYIELDPFEKGSVDIANEYRENGYSELSADGKTKPFDGFSIGDFFKLDGKYKVVRSNEVFTKIELENQLLSLPNHKLLEVA